MALVEPGFPVLLLPPTDAAAAGSRGLADELAGAGAAVLAAPGALPVLPSDHPATDAVCLVQSFYAMLPSLAARRGIDPERPRHLQKVTRTR
jgi:glutamine---fructose-6-phosphate transaminase (isomerizing)